MAARDEASSFSVEFQQEEFSQEKDELVEEAVKIKGQYLSINEVPVATDLMHGPVGYIGPRRLVFRTTANVSNANIPFP